MVRNDRGREIGSSEKISFSTDLARAVCRFPPASYKITGSSERAEVRCMNASFSRTPIEHH